MLTIALALAATAAGADTVPARAAPAAQQAVIVHRQPALPVVALRVSLLADDPPGYAGAGHLVQHLHLPLLEERARRVGGRVQAFRTADAVVYTLTGPAAELDYLAATVTAAFREPQPGGTEMLQSLRALADERAAEREMAAAHVRSALRARLFPTELSAAGTDAGAARLATARMEDVWAAMYRPDRISVVAVGDVQPEAVRSAFAALPEARDAMLAGAAADSVRTLDGEAPQATRGWIGRGWEAGDADPAAATVAARLLRDDLRRRMPQSQVEVEHWWTHRGQAVVLVVATPGNLLPNARRTVTGALESLRGRVDDEAVRRAAAAVRRDMLFFARTPERMAEVLGGFADRGDAPDAAQRFYAAVDRVTADDVDAVLAGFLAQAAAAVEVPPQAVAP
jgi:predicted Zn-dependent peptidase